MKKTVGNPLRSLRHRKFRIYLFGIMISLLGTFVQLQVMRTLGYELSGSGAVVGLISFYSAIPGFLLFILGNWLASVMDRRRILLVTALLAGVPALGLAILSATGGLTTSSLLLASAFLGVVIPFENPARYPYIAHSVPRKDIGNAFAVNQWIVYVAKACGPILGAFALSLWGPAACFAINAGSYGVEFLSLLRLSPCPPRERLDLEKFMELPKFLLTPSNRRVFLNYLLVSLFGVQVHLSPILAGSALNGNGRTIAFLIASAEIGMILGGFLVTTIYDYARFIKPATLGLAVGLIFLGSCHTLPASILAIGVTGICQGIVLSSTQSLLQTRVIDGLRSLLGSTSWTLFFTLQGCGAALLGFQTDRFGIEAVLILSGAFLLLSHLRLLRHR